MAIYTRMQQKHDIEANWIKAKNFIPLEGEIIIYDADENYSYQRIKIGDGITKVNVLPFDNIQGDWNQSDETASDYIKNRTHHPETGVKIETQLTLGEEYGTYRETEYALPEFDITKLVGKIITVKIGDTTYQEELQYGLYEDEHELYYLGSWFASLEGGGDGFGALLYPGSTMSFMGLDMAWDEIAPVTISFELPAKQLDEKYIPDTIARKEDIINLPPYPVTSVNGKTGAVELTAKDVGALSKDTTVPSKTSQLTNDSGYLTSVPSEYVTESELTAKNYALKSEIPSVPVQSVNNKTGLVSLTASDVNAVPTTRTVNNKALSSNITLSASDVGADASGTASSAISTHNANTSAHADIREQISQLSSEKVDKSTLTLGVHTDGLLYIFVDGVATGNGVSFPSQLGDVYGNVDSENNIILSGNLTEGEEYRFVYKMADGSEVEIGEISLVAEVVIDNGLFVPETAKLGCRISSSGSEKNTDADENWLSDYINVEIATITSGEVSMYVKNANMYPTSLNGYPYTRVVFYDTNKTILSNVSFEIKNDAPYAEKLSEMYYKVNLACNREKSATEWGKIKYMRVQGFVNYDSAKITYDEIKNICITINQPIG